MSIQVIITVSVALDDLQRLAGVLRHNPVQQAFQAQNLLGLDGNVGRLALRAIAYILKILMEFEFNSRGVK